MRGRTAGAVVGLILAATIAVLGVPAAAAACPNEAFRTGPSAFLAECRAYEQVTPVDKDLRPGIGEEGGAVVSSSGDSIYFNSLSPYADSQGSLVYNGYISSRTGDAWDTHAIGGPQTGGINAVLQSVSGVFGDLGFSLVSSKNALAPGAIPFGSNLYVRDNRTGGYTLVAAVEGEGTSVEFGLSAIFIGAAADGSSVLISSNSPLTPDAEGGLFEFREGRLRLVAPRSEAPGLLGVTPNVMSTDGDRFFSSRDGHLYLHQFGGETLLASEEITVYSNYFVGATPDDGIAFFVSSSGSLYRSEPAAPEGSRVTELTPPVGPEKESPAVINAVSGEDGTTVYFTAQSQLTPDAAPIPRGEFGIVLAEDLYVWHGEPGRQGEIRYIGQGGTPRQVSPDGRFVGIESIGHLTPDAVDGSAADCSGGAGGRRCRNVFLYSYDTDRLTCVTCSGSPPVGDSRLGGTAPLGLSRLGRARAVLDDGMIFFETPNALSPRDGNGVLDTYAWRDGVVQLISGGTDPNPSIFVGASRDGSNAFFKTEGSLVGQDVDRLMDLYDAKVEGGLPQGGTEASSCAGETGCRGVGAPGSSPSIPATTSVRGARNVAGACLALRGKARAARKRSRALARRAKSAKGPVAKNLRAKAAREAKASKRLGRRAGNCAGGGR